MEVITGFYYDVFKEHGYGMAKTTEDATGIPIFDSIDNLFGILPESK